MEKMNASNKPGKDRELELFEDALVDSLLSAGAEETQDAFTAMGVSPDVVVQRFDAILVTAKAVCSLQRLQLARHELEAFSLNAQALTDAEREAARICIVEARNTISEVPSNLLIAARKGQGASEDDLNSLTNYLAELERLEREGKSLK